MPDGTRNLNRNGLPNATADDVRDDVSSYRHGQKVVAALSTTEEGAHESPQHSNHCCRCRRALLPAVPLGQRLSHGHGVERCPQSCRRLGRGQTDGSSAQGGKRLVGRARTLPCMNFSHSDLKCTHADHRAQRRPATRAAPAAVPAVPPRAPSLAAPPATLPRSVRRCCWTRLVPARCAASSRRRPASPTGRPNTTHGGAKIQNGSVRKQVPGVRRPARRLAIRSSVPPATRPVHRPRVATPTHILHISWTVGAARSVQGRAGGAGLHR